MFFKSRLSLRTRSLAITGILSLLTLTMAWPVPPVHAGDPPAAAAKPTGEDPEIKMGREAHEDMLRSGLKLVKDPKLIARVETIGKKIAAVANVTKLDAGYGSSELVPYDYKFFIVDDPDVNAFSLPGGYIYINKGLLNYIQSDDELAGVLGHEIEHAAHHHVNRLQKEQSKLSNTMAIGMLLTFLAHVPSVDAMNLMQGFQLIAIQKVNGFGQNAERDADHSGLIVATKAGYNPVGMLTFMERLERDQKMRPDLELGIFRTHPPEKERAQAIMAQIKEMGLPIRRRSVTNMLKVEVRPVALSKDGAGKPSEQKASEILLDGKVVYRSLSEERAKKDAATLDRLLDEDVQLYDVTRRGDSVFVRGESVLTVSPDDLTLPGSLQTTEATAEASYKSLRNVLYRELLDHAG